MASPPLATSLASWARPCGDVLELLRDPLTRVLQQLHELWRTLVLRGPQCQGAPRLARASSASDAVDVVLHGDARGLSGIAEVVDDDEGDARDVQAACRDVRGHQDGLLSGRHLGAELAEHLLTLPLLLVTMKGPAPDSFEIILHLLLKKITGTLRRGEDDRAFLWPEALLDVALQRRNFLLELGHDHLMRHILVQSELVPPGALADANLHGRLARETGGAGLHLLRPGRGEEQRLPPGAAASSAGTSALLRRADLRALCDDLTDGRLEAHVEHLVGLIEHKISNPLQHDRRREASLRVARAQVVQAPRRGDDDVRPLLQLADLRALRRAPVEHHHPSPHGGRKLLGLAGNLQRQLAGWRHDEGARPRWLAAPPRQPPRGRRRPALADAREGRQQEAAGLAAAGLRHGHDILACQGDRPGLRLDGARGGVALGGERLRKSLAEDGRGRPEGLERRGAGGVDEDLVELPEGSGTKAPSGTCTALCRLLLLRVSGAAQVVGARLPLADARVRRGIDRAGCGGLLGLVARRCASRFPGSLARCLLLCCWIDHVGLGLQGCTRCFSGRFSGRSGCRLLVRHFFGVLRLRRWCRLSGGLAFSLCLVHITCATKFWICSAHKAWTQRHGLRWRGAAR
mmetsp:Transcript_64225/g.171817  ORF Transcript_64225/g.171817 Transcript_64225/m.171817 type:complete len:631 (+) Transcript_64225:336-2228(+)